MEASMPNCERKLNETEANMKLQYKDADGYSVIIEHPKNERCLLYCEAEKPHRYIPAVLEEKQARKIANVLLRVADMMEAEKKGEI